MAEYIYLRVSTRNQDYAQQLEDIKRYGVDPKSVDGIVEEHESGGVSYEDRQLQTLLGKCKRGDTIYVGDTSRIGRSQMDMVRLMINAKEAGIGIVACKNGLRLDADDIGSRITLSVLAILDEDERMRIKHRAKNTVEAHRKEIEAKGYRVTKAGNIQTHIGNAPGTDMSAAIKSAIIARSQRAQRWREESPAYRWAMEQKACGKTAKQAYDELEKLMDVAPETFCKRSGGRISRSTFYDWWREKNILHV